MQSSIADRVSYRVLYRAPLGKSDGADSAEGIYMNMHVFFDDHQGSDGDRVVMLYNTNRSLEVSGVARHMAQSSFAAFPNRGS